MSPRFQYEAKSGPHKKVEGFIDADNHDHAINEIIRSGLTPLEVREKSVPQRDQHISAKRRPFFAIRISKKDLLLFTRQLADLLDSAVPLFKAIQLAGKQTQNKELQRIIQCVQSDVSDGVSFSEALSKRKYVFPRYYVNMVRAGEVSGRLDVVLARLSAYLEKEEEISGNIRTSLAYPAFVFIIGCITVFVLLSFVVPRLAVMFEDFHQSLPVVTIVLMRVSAFFEHFWWLVGMLFIGGGKLFFQWIQTEEGKKWLDTRLLKLWIVGSFIRMVEVGRFARTLGTLIESDVKIVTALETVTATAGNMVLKEELRMASAEVTQGASLGKALRSVTFFPEMAVNMIAIGEEAGRFEKGLYKVADVYERESEVIRKTAVSLLGPLVLTVVIAVIGAVVIAMLLPIMQMNQLVG